MSRPTLAAAAAVLIAGCPTMIAAPAHAITPPAIDDTYLPPPAVPMPPLATEQHAACGTPTIDPARVGAAADQRNALDLPSVWPLTRGRGQTVAVIDTGVSPHPRLPRLRPGGDYVSDGDGMHDCDGHGTIVAGIIAGSPSAVDAFSGVAPDVSVIAIRQSSNKFGPTDGAGAGFGDVDTLAMAVRTAADMGATVINISTVACMEAAAMLDDRALGAALAYAVDVKDAVVVAAAGNVDATGQCPQQNPVSKQPEWDTVTVAVSPGWYDDYVLTVGSTSPDGAPSGFSLAGPWVDVAAPGEGLVSLSSDGEGLANAFATDNGLAPISGTSFAAPVISGVAALVRARFPQLSAREVMRRIESTAHRPAAGWDAFVGSGTVDARSAVSDGPTVPDETVRADTTRPVPLPDSPPPDRSGRTAAIAGAAACAAILAVAVALRGPRRRRERPTRRSYSARHPGPTT